MRGCEGIGLGDNAAAYGGWSLMDHEGRLNFGCWCIILNGRNKENIRYHGRFYDNNAVRIKSTENLERGGSGIGLDIIGFARSWLKRASTGCRVWCGEGKLRCAMCSRVVPRTATRAHDSRSYFHFLRPRYKLPNSPTLHPTHTITITITTSNTHIHLPTSHVASTPARPLPPPHPQKPPPHRTHRLPAPPRLPNHLDRSRRPLSLQ